MTTDTPPPGNPALHRWKLHLGLFLATCVSVLWAGAEYGYPSQPPPLDPETPLQWLQFLWSGWSFALPLMAILVCHEFGHWFAARYHRVPASLPYFLPLPKIGLLGTLGAVIAMPGRIHSRNALLDIGAAGPLAGLLVTLPVLFLGLRLSPVTPLPQHYVQEGQSLLYALLKRLALGEIPAGHDVFLHPTALAGWAGLLITMINLLPWGQLDGGHIAFALFGERQHRVALWMRRALLLLFAYNLVYFSLGHLDNPSLVSLAQAFGNSLFWLMWFVLTGVLGHFFGHEHPPFEQGELSRGRRVLAAATLLCFVLLFMPTPMAIH